MKKNFAKISGAGESKWRGALQFASFLLTKPGMGLLKKMASRYLRKAGIIKDTTPTYNEWIKAQLNPTLLQKDFDSTSGTLTLKPKISIVIIPSSGNAQHTIISVMEQLYDNWELCMAQGNPLKDARIKQLPVIDISNIAASLNTLSATATGSYILFMEAGDRLTANCLHEVVKHINAHPADALIYTDEDVANDGGTFSSPHFKPAWSPDSFLSRNYIGHTVSIKKELLAQTSGFREGYGVSTLYDMLLRATELTSHIGHIPAVLYHCLAHQSTANTTTVKKALTAAMLRRDTPATVQEVAGAPGCYYLEYEITNPGRVSVIIPTKDNTALLKTTIDSILQKTTYPDFEILVLNNNSTSPEFFALMKEYTQKHSAIFRCIDANFPFNFAKLMNLGAADSTGTYLLLCNNDIEVIHPDWMTKMVAYAQHEKTGAVGVKLLYPDDTIQHAGIILSPADTSRHIYANQPKDANGYNYALKATTNYAAVTAACMMCRKEVYNKAGGMDETLEVEYNDIDLCLALLKNGYYNIYLPAVTLYHHESATRGHPFRSRTAWRQHAHDLTIFKHKWQPLINDDPFYNQNMDKIRW